MIACMFIFMLSMHRLSMNSFHDLHLAYSFYAFSSLLLSFYVFTHLGYSLHIFFSCKAFSFYLFTQFQVSVWIYRKSFIPWNFMGCLDRGFDPFPSGLISRLIISAFYGKADFFRFSFENLCVFLPVTTAGFKILNFFSNFHTKAIQKL